MQVHVINVDRDADRWERFMRLNGDVIDVVRVPTSDGVRAVDRADLVESGIIAETCRRGSPGARAQAEARGDRRARRRR